MGNVLLGSLSILITLPLGLVVFQACMQILDLVLGTAIRCILCVFNATAIVNPGKVPVIQILNAALHLLTHGTIL